MKTVNFFSFGDGIQNSGIIQKYENRKNRMFQHFSVVLASCLCFLLPEFTLSQSPTSNQTNATTPSPTKKTSGNDAVRDALIGVLIGVLVPVILVSTFVLVRLKYYDEANNAAVTVPLKAAVAPPTGGASTSVVNPSESMSGGSTEPVAVQGD